MGQLGGRFLLKGLSVVDAVKPYGPWDRDTAPSRGVHAVTSPVFSCTEHPWHLEGNFPAGWVSVSTVRERARSPLQSRIKPLKRSLGFFVQMQNEDEGWSCCTHGCG